MSTLVMPEADALNFFLSFHPPQNGVEIFSGFVHALKEARGITSRDERTGVKHPNNTGKHGSWLGAMGYFSLLDQIGKSLKPRITPRKAGNSIQMALGHFTTLSSAEIDALYALRCAFAHDYSLYNFNKKQPSLMHNFIVSQGESTVVVTLPTKPWDGNLQNQKSESKTHINLEAFGDLVESVVNSVYAHNQNNGLEILLADGSDELVRRYMFMS